jgi:hypothetical protein
MVASTTLKGRCFAGRGWTPDLGLLCPHKFTAIVISKSNRKIFFMAGTILSHQVKFFAGSVPNPQRVIPSAARNPSFSAGNQLKGFRAVFGMTECMLTRVLNISDCA